MADVKWIKIVTDIFDDEKMLAIECMPDGRDIELIWFKILCLAGKSNDNGFLTINKKIAYTDEMLSKVFRMGIGVIQRALDIFVGLEMIEVVDNTYMVSNWLMHQSGDRLEVMKEQHREAQRRYRAKQKDLLIEKKNVSDVTSDVTNDIIPSYSISNSISISNSNKSNKYNIDDIIDSFDFDEETKEVIKEWLTYKKEKRQEYKETGAKSLIKQIYNRCQEYGYSKVRDVIEKSMGSNYQGIVWDWLKENQKKGIDWSKV